MCNQLHRLPQTHLRKAHLHHHQKDISDFHDNIIHPAHEQVDAPPMDLLLADIQLDLFEATDKSCQLVAFKTIKLDFVDH